MANSVIYSNMLLLSWVYEQNLAVGDKEAITLLKGVLPPAWRYVNLTGDFDFTTGTPPVDIKAPPARYENRDIWRRSMQEGDKDDSK